MAELRRTSAEVTSSKRIAFGDYQFDYGTHLLWRGDQEVKLVPRASALLAVLAERSMHVVTKKELLERLWNGKAVGDDALTSCVQELRRALGDDPRNPRFVETRHRRGYRLLVPVISAAVESATAERRPWNKASIAVLPFQNLSGDPKQAYFADGLAEDVITGLSRISWLFVIARNSSFALRGETLDARSIGERLGVRYLVEGSVRHARQRLRLTVQLVEAATGNYLWADRYEGLLEDVFDFQDRTVASLVGAIEPKLRATEIARARRKRPDNLDAFDLYLQALPKIAAMSAQGTAEAIELLDRAISLSPDYTEAVADAALCRMLRPIQGYSSDEGRDFREAAELSRRALDTDPADPIALDVAAFLPVLLHRDYQTGWDLIDRSLAINPNDARAWSARGWISAWAGKTDMALAEFRNSLSLSPLDPQWSSGCKHGIASALCWGGRPKEALLWARQAVQERPGWGVADRMLIATLWMSGRRAEAERVAKRHVEAFPRLSVRHLQEISPVEPLTGQRYFDALREAGLPK